jgi:hypothetical protein
MARVYCVHDRSARTPEQIQGRKVAELVLTSTITGLQEGGKIYIDDVALYRLDDTVPTIPVPSIRFGA